MIVVLKRQQINSCDWDNFIESTPQRTVYAMSWFLDLIPQEWGAVVELDSRGNFIAALPFQTKKKYGFTKIEQDAFTNELGIYSLKSSHPTLLIEVFFKKFKFISRYYFNTYNQIDILNALPFETTYLLDLNRSYEMIQKSYSTNRHRNLKKAQNESQSIIESTAIDDLILTFKNHISPKIDGISDYQYQLIKSVYTAASNKKKGFILQVKNESGELLSSAFFLQSFNRLIYFFAASTPKGLSSFANTDTVLDFEGGSIESIGKFYSSFGASSVKIYSYRKMWGKKK